nr:glycosyltransferase family 39 protein [Lachnospiraceae bacterium]
KLPQVNPYTLFGYYHPPFHHILETIWLKLNILLGVSEELAFENLQILTLFYSCLLMVVCYGILKTLKVEGRGMIIGMCFIAFHPATIIMSGSVNNDMLTILFMALIILETLLFIREKCLKHLVLLALCIGLGMITKLNAAVLAIPVAIIFLMHFIGIIKTKDRQEIIKWVKNYAIFAVTVMPIGLSWVIRNEVKYSEHPGVPVPGPTSPLYTENYSLWTRLGIPSLAQWHFDFPFHPLRSAACSNTWAIMFHTAIYAEEYPTDITDGMRFLCQVTFVLSVLLALWAIWILFKVFLDKRSSGEDRIFVLTGYVAMIISFIAFVIIYPYTCSSDFRYITICLVYTVMAVGLANKYKYKWISVFNVALIAFLGMITVIYMLWDRW